MNTLPLAALLFTPLLCAHAWAAASGGDRPGGAKAVGKILLAIRADEAARVGESAALRRAAYHRDPAVRAAAFRAMGRIGALSCAKTLTVGFADRDPAAREEAVFAAGQLGLAENLADGEREKLAAALRLALRKAAPGLRPAVLEALGKTGGPSSEKLLASLLADPDPRARGEAALALFRLRLLKRIPEYSPSTIEGLKAAFSDTDPSVRWRAVYALSRWPEPGARDALSRELEDGISWARFFAARGLAQLGATAPVESLAKAAHDADPLVRAEAVKALGAAGRADLLDAAVFADPVASVREAAAETLGASKRPELAARLNPLLSEGSVLVRGAALAALTNLQGAAALPLLEKEATHPHWWVRSKVCASLKGVPEAAGLLRARLADRDGRVAAEALSALAVSTAAFSDAELADVLASTTAAVEVVAAAVGAASARKSAAFIDPLLAAADGPQARAIAELYDDIRKAVHELGQAQPDRAADAGKPPPVKPGEFRLFDGPPGEAVVVLETEKGEIEISLYGKEAPSHAGSFLALVRSGLYKDTVWHRVVPGFVIQGGDPMGTGWGDAGYSLRDEINGARFDRGVVGMPNAGPDTGGCQLFITLVPTPHLDGKYTAFGRVTRGMEVVDRIEPGDRILGARVEGAR